MFMPFNVLGIWLRGLFSVVLLGLGIYLLTQWYRHRETVVFDGFEVSKVEANEDREPQSEATQERWIKRHWQFGLNRETAFLLGGTTLVGWSFLGGWVWSPRLFRRRGANEPKNERAGHERAGQIQNLRMPDGSKVRVESFGPPEGDPVILTHGWGLDANEWYYTRKYLSENKKNRVITWDLPGLGASDRPTDRDWSLEQLARTLDAVIATAGDKPVVLIGHSIGVMIILTHCKLFPNALGQRVRGLVLAQSTYTNPVKTTAMAGLYMALQNPVLVPLCHLMVWFSPVFRVLHCMSYLNGSAHRSTERGSFSGDETRGQLEFMARYYCKSAPDVVARGMLGMLKYDATEILGRITVPTLVVAGDLDSVCLPDASRYMAQTIPHARLFVLIQAKHCGLFEHHEIFHKALNDFFASLPRIEESDGSRHSEKPSILVTVNPGTVE